MKSIAIIGAGLAGITLAAELQDCAQTRVFEKSRGFGGRMATRRTGSFQFDHGAQFFTARSKQFQSLIDRYLAEGLVRPWQPRVLSLDPDKKPFKREWFEPHYVAVPGMNGLARELAQEQDVMLNTRVAAIEPNEENWLLSDSEGEDLGRFDWVISTLPAPQAQELLPDCFTREGAFNEVDFSPCFSLMLGFDHTPALNFDAAVVRNSPLGWIAVNSSKQDDPGAYALVIHSDNEWARTQLDGSLDEVRQRMLEALDRLLGDALPQPQHIEIHRWKYVRAETGCKEHFLLDTPNRLAACGDWCGGSRVEDAYLSGLKLGQHMRSLLLRST